MNEGFSLYVFTGKTTFRNSCCSHDGIQSACPEVNIAGAAPRSSGLPVASIDSEFSGAKSLRPVMTIVPNKATRQWRFAKSELQ
jgi:hypothetical protein